MSAFLGVLKNHGLPKLCTRPCLFLICTLQHQAQNSASSHGPPILSKNCARLARLLQPPHYIQLLSRRKLSRLSSVALSVHPHVDGYHPSRQTRYLLGSWTLLLVFPPLLLHFPTFYFFYFVHALVPIHATNIQHSFSSHKTETFPGHTSP